MLLQKGAARFLPHPKVRSRSTRRITLQFAAGGDLLKADTDEIIFGGDGDDFLDASTGGWTHYTVVMLTISWLGCRSVVGRERRRRSICW